MRTTAADGQRPFLGCFGHSFKNLNAKENSTPQARKAVLRNLGARFGPRSLPAALELRIVGFEGLAVGDS
jgi:hypothetical protein